MTQKLHDSTLTPSRTSNPLPRGSRTLCLPCDPEAYSSLIAEPAAFRAWLDQQFQFAPELFPASFTHGYLLKDSRCSRKCGLRLRRIQLADRSCYSVRPSFLMPYLSARVSEVESGLFLRKFGVPFWALPRVCGRNPMFWYRLECGLGRASIVGTTVRRVPVPVHLLADEHHQRRNGSKTYLATTVGAGCCLGVEPSDTADTAGLQTAYEVFRTEAHDVDPKYAPQTVNTDAWAATQAAWKVLFPPVALLLCYLHAWLSLRERGRHLGALFIDLSHRVWDAYRAPTRRCFSQRLRHLRTFAQTHLTGIIQEKTLSLCKKRERFAQAYRYPGGHRTSNMLDRVMRSMHRYFFDGQHLHGTQKASRLHCRSWALLYNFTPWSPSSTRKNKGFRCPAERLNQHRYHEHWLQNLLVSASMGGYRQLPQNS